MPPGAETGNIPTMMDDKPPEVQIPEPGSHSSRRSERSSSLPPELPPELPPISPPRLEPAPATRRSGVLRGVLVVAGVIGGSVIVIAMFGSGSGSRSPKSSFSGSGVPGGGGGYVPPAVPAQPVAVDQNPRGQFDNSQPLNVSRIQTAPANRTFPLSKSKRVNWTNSTRT